MLWQMIVIYRQQKIMYFNFTILKKISLVTLISGFFSSRNLAKAVNYASNDKASIQQEILIDFLGESHRLGCSEAL